MTYKLAILKSESGTDHLGWVKACHEKRSEVQHEIIDIIRDDWMVHFKEKAFDMLLARPPGERTHFKNLYDERVWILHRVLDYPVYPSMEEILIYENKKLLRDWLVATEIPHPATHVFFDRKKAEKHVANAAFPVVAKSNIGGGASGVFFLRTKDEALKYISRAFSEKGIERRWGPNLRKGDIGKRMVKRLKNIPGTVNYFKEKRDMSVTDPQKWFVIFQDYMEIRHEWRCVKIGESMFAHVKVPGRSGVASGTSRVDWSIKPPESLLDFAEAVCNKRGFLSQAVDVFESNEGEYFVNELQCFFGSKNPHQMIIDGKPGRYLRSGEGWIFEEGHFNRDNSFHLRLDHVIRLLNEKRSSQ